MVPLKVPSLLIIVTFVILVEDQLGMIKLSCENDFIDKRPIVSATDLAEVGLLVDEFSPVLIFNVVFVENQLLSLIVTF